MCKNEIKFFVGETNKNPLSYKCDEIMTFTITPRLGENFLDIPEFRFYRWMIDGDDGRHEEGYISSMDRKPIVLTTTLKRPGFVRVIVEACDGEKQPLHGVDRFEGGAGAEVEKIELDSVVPDDYADFWQSVKESIKSVDIGKAKLTEYTASVDTTGYDIYLLEIAMPFGNPATGVMAIPENTAGMKLPAQINFCGYGVTKTEPVLVPGTISLTMNAHGLDISKDISYFNELYKEPEGELFYYGFDNVENSLPETTYFKGMIARDLVGAEFIKSMEQWNGRDLIATGGSQGAFQAVNVAAHDESITALNVNIPWFSNLGGYRKDRMRGWSPDYTYGLCYYDTAVAARFVKCPVKITAKLGDYVCPPSGIMALYNGIKTPVELIFKQNGTHIYDCPVEMAYTLGHL